MTLLLTFAVMTAVAVLTVLWPLYRRAPTSRSGSELAVYCDQLQEIERDRLAGYIGKTEAEAARVEVSRRLLAAADAPEATASIADEKSIAWRRRAVGLTALLLLPLGTAGLYLELGSPESATQPLVSQREKAPDQDSIESMVAKVEAHLKRKPDDGRAWEVLAPVYLRLGRYEDSVRAWQNALSILGENADREESLGESLVTVANGVVTTDAQAAFNRALTIDRNAVAARFYLGLAAEQDGRRKEARKAWRDLIASAPAGAHWVGSVREALARLDGEPGESQTDVIAPAHSDPSTQEMQAAAKLPPEQQDAMIRGMVDRLAARLKTDGSDLDGWIRLVRSYHVLGESDKADAAIADARRALAAYPEKLARLDQALRNEGAVARVSPRPDGPEGETNLPATEPQNAMIRAMVERLAARLKQNGNDVDGWLQLMRSYTVLGDREKALEAAADARKAISNDQEKLRLLNEGERELSLVNP
jgi:cytochrome c-type biogenesis protein CcmH